jgi:D-3-phosphoglycerate dehydrogenase
MSTFTLPARWNRSQWHTPGRVAIAARGAGGVNRDDVVQAALLAHGLHLTVEPLHHADGHVAATFTEADVVISGVGLKEADIAQFAQARLILRPYVGYDDIDVAAATAHGILFANIPDAFSEEVANHALTLILGMNQQLLISDRYVRSGEWADHGGRPARVTPIRRLSVLTVGLIGFGVIARLTAERLRPFGFKVLAYDPFVEQSVADHYGVTMASFDDVLSHADFVSVHTFLAASTRHLINADRLAQMKQGAYLINTARGPIVDEVALVEALKSGHLAGAGLDVTEVEPLAKDSPLHDLPNVILTPHMSSESVEAGHAVRRRTHEISSSVALGGLPDRHVCQNRPLFDQIKAALDHGA